MVSMHSLPQGYRAIVLGSSGGIGAAFANALKADPKCAEVLELSRSSTPAFDLGDETSISAAAESIDGEVQLILDATGFLSDEDTAPEKSLRSIEADNMAKLFELNAIGPILLIKHFSKLMPRNGKSVFATLSARVGSIGDNHLGGWYAYRASKAALNMIVKSAAIEIARSRPEAVLVSLHPGTVATPLSDPFAGERVRLSPDESASMLLKVLDGLGAGDTGTFWDYKNTRIEW